VLITNMDPGLQEDYLAMTWELRRAGIPTELYLGTAKGPGKQLKYGDAWGIPIAILYGSNEKEKGIVTLKDMDVGRQRAEALANRQEWLEERPGQREVPRAGLVAAIRDMLKDIETQKR
jgi:histidyl-tRNA synthetase